MIESEKSFENEAVIEYIKVAKEEDKSPELVRINAEVIKVIDGDTLVVEIKKQLSIRLLHYCNELNDNDEEKKECAALQLEYLENLIKNAQDIKLEFQLSGKNLSHMFTFGRLLGTIKVDGEDVSAKMIEAGMATAADPKKVKIK